MTSITLDIHPWGITIVNPTPATMNDLATIKDNTQHINQAWHILTHDHRGGGSES